MSMIDMRTFDSASAVLAGGAWIRLQGPRMVDIVRWYGGGQAPALVATDTDGHRVVVPLASIVAVEVEQLSEYVPPHRNIDTSPIDHGRATLGRPDGLARGPDGSPARVSAR